jgi:hypothetical protein
MCRSNSLSDVSTLISCKRFLMALERIFGIFHLQTLPKPKEYVLSFTPVDNSLRLQLYYIDNLIYLSIIGITKLSVLIFYLRIFPSQAFKVACHVIISWIGFWTVVIVLVSSLRCIPVPFLWVGWTGTITNETCLNVNALIYSSSAINITQDVMVLLLPFPWLVKLNVSLRKKISILLIFSLGIL